MKTIRILIILLIAVAPAYSELILSEILSNEPNNRVLLEWFEIYNNSDTTVDLTRYKFVEGHDTLELPDGAVAPAHSYVVLSRRPVPRNGSDCFEYHWGDSSGVWGDSPEENYNIYEVDIALTNSGSAIYILRWDNSGVDHFTWASSSDDGRSVERDNVANPFSGWHECYEVSGSTPGRENSLLPTDDDRFFISVEPRTVSLARGEKIMTIVYGTPTGTDISIYIYDDSAMRRRTLLESSDEAVAELSWNLQDDNANELPVGLYFLLFRTDGEVSVQKSIPIVIAP